MKITVNKFKGIDNAVIELDDITIFVGANNAGKSSFIQAIQFAVSGCQTMDLHSIPWRNAQTDRATSFNSDEFLYTPTRNIESLYHKAKLTERTESIKISFENEIGTSTITFGKGRNKGISTKLVNKPLGNELCNLNNPFCVYVPGIAGIPIVEVYEPEIKVRKSAVRGDSNNFLRNILLRIRNDENAQKWTNFIESLNKIYSELDITVSYNENESEFIVSNVTYDGETLPLDSIGTGVLQTMQIFAYMEYFSPKILLLDEPDSHLHPTKQRLLASEIKRRSELNPDMKVVFSTHSMQLLRSLSTVKTYHFINGKAELTENESAVLMDIGALDADYLFSKPNLKYVILTEDNVDNIKEKKNFIKQFVLSHGLNENEFVLHSYQGCKNMHTASVLQALVRKHIPAAKVIVHIDKDQRLDENDADIVTLSSKANTHDVLLFITEFSEIENYFCNPEHISNIYHLNLPDIQELYTTELQNLKALTSQKLSDFILNERSALIMDDKKRIKTQLLDEIIANEVNTKLETLCPGKELMAKIRVRLQNEFGVGDLSLLVAPSQSLKSDVFQKLISRDE
ncbi:ATP-binding protein [Maribellus sp. YY47]|uniref:ATP-dependent nuclease n=1 Tax=Maribellus sp. YY47 TaxID=2929486 RepID=UPI002001ACD5|nr:ATP-binding protein [Maribellus sp. YY47]MCK3684283.1 AAA family ATPase [Maribellus sp. YY47]